MLILRNIRVWDTGEIIDMVIPSADARNQPEDGGVIEGDFDATGLTVAPGFADPHVHFRDPGQTYKESMVSGCRAAASGGYTNVLIMPNTVPAMDGRAVKAGASGAAEVLDAGCSDVIDYLQHYERVHDVSLPVRYDLCVCASRTAPASRRATRPTGCAISTAMTWMARTRGNWPTRSPPSATTGPR